MKTELNKCIICNRRLVSLYRAKGIGLKKHFKRIEAKYCINCNKIYVTD